MESRMSSTEVARPSAGALSGIRVLDVTGSAGNYCGKLFADLGADVILVEPPGGTALRREGPFAGDAVHIEASLPFAYQNTNKRGMVLDLDHEQGPDILRALVARADVLLVTERPGQMERRGLGYSALAAVKPSLVYASITPFGQTGPYADYAAEDIVSMALGGMLYLAGYADSAPLEAYGNQAHVAASLFTSVAAMAALYSAEATGRGEFIDVSTQECVVMGLENAAQFYDLERVVRKRYAGEQRQAGSGVYHCKDGMIYMLAGGVASNRFWRNSVAWLIEEGLPGAEELAEDRWQDMAFLATSEAKARFAEIFNPFALTRTKAEFYEIGRKRRIPICPVATPADILASRQLQYREFFASVENPFLGRPVVMPGAPYKLSATPWALRRRAPKLGEHTLEILEEIGLGRDDAEVLLRERVI